jgi:hypothetical protein
LPGANSSDNFTLTGLRRAAASSVFSEFPAGRKRAALRGDPLDLPAELDLLVEERVTGPSVGFALVRKVQVVKGLGRGSGEGDHVPVPSACVTAPTPGENNDAVAQVPGRAAVEQSTTQQWTLIWAGLLCA